MRNPLSESGIRNRIEAVAANCGQVFLGTRPV